MASGASCAAQSVLEQATAASSSRGRGMLAAGLQGEWGVMAEP